MFLKVSQYLQKNTCVVENKQKQKIKNKMKKIPAQVGNVCEVLAKKYWTVGYLELVKVFKFSDKILGFQKTIELCLSMEFCVT